LSATVASSSFQDVSMHIAKAVMEVSMPDGTTVDVPMHDNGLTGGDLVAGDGLYSASFSATMPGTYILEAILNGDLDPSDGSTTDYFQRTAQHVVTVSSATAALSGKALSKIIDSERINILIAVTGSMNQPTLRGYTEVWGTTPSGELKPACWIGGIVTQTPGFVSLELNLNWLKMAGVSAPLILRNTYLSDITTSFPISAYEQDIHVLQAASLPRFLSPVTNMTITDEMRYGVNPLPAIETDAAAPTLLMLPGYCTNVNPWASSAADFTDAFFPADKGNYANHVYAQKMLAQAQAKGMTKYGVIGHSQGGMVAVHLHNYFFTGLDMASTENGAVLLQSLGTPFQGNTAAGSSASLGELFGIGCGSNTDLSRDGAVNWLSGISGASRSKLQFYSTTYELGKFFGDWCSLPMNIILQWPNDGVTELSYAPLPGAADKGNTQKWCHSVDMGYAPQYTDHARNRILNQNAAR